MYEEIAEKMREESSHDHGGAEEGGGGHGAGEEEGGHEGAGRGRSERSLLINARAETSQRPRQGQLLGSRFCGKKEFLKVPVGPAYRI